MADTGTRLRELAEQWREHQKTCLDPGCDEAHERCVRDVESLLDEPAPDDAPDHLAVLADELLGLSMPGTSYGADRARWDRNARGVIARIFRLGMTVGWDKAQAAAGQEPRRG